MCLLAVCVSYAVRALKLAFTDVLIFVSWVNVLAELFLCVWCVLAEFAVCVAVS